MKVPMKMPNRWTLANRAVSARYQDHNKKLITDIERKISDNHLENTVHNNFLRCWGKGLLVLTVASLCIGTAALALILWWIFIGSG